MKGFDDGPDGLNDDAFDRALAGGRRAIRPRRPHGESCSCPSCSRFWSLARATRGHGEMCPCDSCREVRS